MNASPCVVKMEKDLSLPISVHELKLRDVNNQLNLSILKCEKLTKDNEKLSRIEDDLSKQVNHLPTNSINIFI